MASEKETLKQIRGLIATGRTQGAYARDADSFPVSARGDAAAFCPIGAALRVSAPLYSRIIARLNRAVLPVRTIADWNDAPERTKDDVLALLDRMIAETAA